MSYTVTITNKNVSLTSSIRNNLGRTITLYPVDANYLQNKFNNILQRFNEYEGNDFEFNND